MMNNTYWYTTLDFELLKNKNMTINKLSSCVCNDNTFCFKYMVHVKYAIISFVMVSQMIVNTCNH